MVQLREKRVTQTGPLCRKPLPPGPDKLFDLGYRIYAKTMAVVDPNDEGHAVWGNLFLSPAQQQGMDQLVPFGLKRRPRDTCTRKRIAGLCMNLVRVWR